MRRIHGRIREMLFHEFPSLSPNPCVTDGNGRVMYREKDGRIYTSLTNKELNKLKKKYKLPDLKKSQLTQAVL